MPKSTTTQTNQTHRKRQAPAVYFDVDWLAGNKPSPDPLPLREDYLASLPQASSTYRNPLPLNLLASFLGLSLCCGLGTAWFYRSNIQDLWEQSAVATNKSSTTLPPAGIDKEKEREANETIEAILALQELAVPNDVNKPNTQKR